MFAQMTRKLTCIQIVGAANAVADVEIDSFAFIEIGDALSAAVGGSNNQEGGSQQAAHQRSKHHVPPFGTIAAPRLLPRAAIILAAGLI